MGLEAPRRQQTRKAYYAGAVAAAEEEGFSRQEIRGALKILRRYELEGQPFGRRWDLEVGLCRLAIALSLVRFFQNLA